MSKTSKILYFIIALAFFIIFDIYFSNLILQYTPNFQENPVFDLVFVQNTGAAFSLLEDSRMFLIGFSIVAVCGIIIYLIKNILRVSVFTLYWVAMLIAGILCNTYERIVFGYVRDFFKLNFVNFPVFNISDVFINISVFAIVIIIIKNEISNRRINGRKKD